MTRCHLGIGGRHSILSDTPPARRHPAEYRRAVAHELGRRGPRPGDEQGYRHSFPYLRGLPTDLVARTTPERAVGAPSGDQDGFLTVASAPTSLGGRPAIGAVRLRTAR